MTRISIVLAVVLVLCALALVTSQHHARKLFIELERTQTQGKELEVHWKQLQVEQTQLTNASLVDTKARRSLRMEAVSPARTLHLNVAPTPVTTEVEKR